MKYNSPYSTAAYGINAKDWEGGVNYDRLRRERLARAQAALEAAQALAGQIAADLAHAEAMAADAAQAEAAARVMGEVAAAGIWGAPLVTEVKALDVFWPAEAEHDDYFNRTPWSGYCRVVIAPKVAKFRKYYGDRLKKPAA